jgi:hypothetical protein
MKPDRPDRDAIHASYWQFDPDDAGDPEVAAMDSRLSLVRSEDHVLIAERGKPGRRYEAHDAAWLELTDAEALRLIERLAAALRA